jgi:RNA polymerase sigma-70 factor (ECF subfamily)
VGAEPRTVLSTTATVSGRWSTPPRAAATDRSASERIPHVIGGDVRKHLGVLGALGGVVAGSEERFETWYRAERPRVLAALTIVTGDRDLAMEATDEAFARAYERWRRVSAMTNPTGWLYRVALNQVRRLARRRAFESRLRFRLASPPPDAMVSSDVDLWAAIGALPNRQRHALVLRYVADLPEVEVSRIMGITRGAVSSAASKARSNLEQGLGPVQVEEPR